MLSLTTIVYVRHFKNEIPLTIDQGREMSTISGNGVVCVVGVVYVVGVVVFSWCSSCRFCSSCSCCSSCS